MAKREPFTVYHCIERRMTLVITCSACHRRRYYDPNDMMKIVGNIDVRNVTNRMRCETCRTGDYLRVDYKVMSAQERQTIRLRRLKEIKTVKRGIWVDE